MRFPRAIRLVVCGRAPAEAMRAAVERKMETLRLPINATKIRCLRVPEEPVEFLGYRIGCKYNPCTGHSYIGTRPSRDSVRSICRKISEATEARYGLLESELVVERLNRAMLGWVNYFQLGQVSPAYCALDRHATKRLRPRLSLDHGAARPGAAPGQCAGRGVRHAGRLCINSSAKSRRGWREAIVPPAVLVI